MISTGRAIVVQVVGKGCQHLSPHRVHAVERATAHVRRATDRLGNPRRKWSGSEELGRGRDQPPGPPAARWRRDAVVDRDPGLATAVSNRLTDPYVVVDVSPLIYELPHDTEVGGGLHLWQSTGDERRAPPVSAMTRLSHSSMIGLAGCPLTSRARASLTPAGTRSTRSRRVGRPVGWDRSGRLAYLEAHDRQAA